MAAGSVRREPFRLMFPVGVLLAWAGVAPWVLFGTGVMRPWPGIYHALTMTQAFLLSIAIGFLTTMIPRRMRAAPISRVELSLCVAGVLAIPPFSALQWYAPAEGAALLVMIVLSQFAIRRLLQRKAEAPPTPPSFVFVPAALVAGVVGASLILASALGGAAWAFALGRSLVQEGVLLALVLALSPLLTGLVLRGAAPEVRQPQAGRAMLLHSVAALLVLASFPLQIFGSLPAGFALRGAVALIEVIVAGGALTVATEPGLHRKLYRLSLLFVPVGPLAAAAAPALRVPALHFTFVGGFSLMVFAVSSHVAFLHTGREALARRWPWPVVAVGLLTLAATAARVTAERFGDHYFEALTVASSLWMGAALVWGLYLIAMIARPPRERSA